jgi:Spy/CpxP family protein refolding chaperone
MGHRAFSSGARFLAGFLQAKAAIFHRVTAAGGFTKLYTREKRLKRAPSRLPLQGRIAPWDDWKERPMSHHETSSSSSSGPAPEPQPTPRRARRYLTITAVAVAAALTGAVATQAFSEGFGRGHWHGHGMMGGPMMGQPFDPARAEQRADRMVRHLAIEIDATAEQQEKLRSIVKATVKDLLPLRERSQAARQRARQLLTQPTIDRAAIEAFRAEHIAQMDAATKRLSQALADAADVLTPQQRQQINEHLEHRRGYWRGWHRG